LKRGPENKFLYIDPPEPFKPLETTQKDFIFGSEKPKFSHRPQKQVKEIFLIYKTKKLPLHIIFRESY